MTRTLPFVIAAAIGLGACTRAASPGDDDRDSKSTTPVHRAIPYPDTPIERLTRLVEKDPNDIDSLVRLGHLLLGAHDYARASEVTGKALELDASHAEALVHHAALLTLEGKDAEAAALLDALSAKAPALAEVWYHRGMLAIRRSEHDVARESFDRYIALAPDGEWSQQVQTYLDMQRALLKERAVPAESATR